MFIMMRTTMKMRVCCMPSRHNHDFNWLIRLTKWLFNHWLIIVHLFCLVDAEGFLDADNIDNVTDQDNNTATTAGKVINSSTHIDYGTINSFSQDLTEKVLNSFNVPQTTTSSSDNISSSSYLSTSSPIPVASLPQSKCTIRATPPGFTIQIFNLN